MEKQEARRSILLKLLHVTDKAERSKQIVSRLFSLTEIQKASSIAAYFALENEVNLDALIYELMRQKKTLSVPVATENEIKFVEITRNAKLKEGIFGIREPMSGSVQERLDLIIVPMVGFDENKNRLGHGKGYYDKALENSSAIKIGVAFEAQREEFECCEHDIKMDIIVTEDRVIR